MLSISQPISDTVREILALADSYDKTEQIHHTEFEQDLGFLIDKFHHLRSKFYSDPNEEQEGWHFSMERLLKELQDIFHQDTFRKTKTLQPYQPQNTVSALRAELMGLQIDHQRMHEQEVASWNKKRLKIWGKIADLTWQDESAPTEKGAPADGRAKKLPVTVQKKPKGEGRNRGTPKAEANVLVREWLDNHAKEIKADPFAITREGIQKDIEESTGIKVSTGNISNTLAWKTFDSLRKAESKPKPREIPWTDRMQASIPDDLSPDVAELFAKQEEEKVEQERRHKARHKRRHDGI